MQNMKVSQEISSQATTDLEASSFTILDKTTETTPLDPLQLQQLLQQFNLQEHDLAAADISSLLLKWYGRFSHWLLREPLLFKILQCLFRKNGLKGASYQQMMNICSSEFMA
jgi:hypothetical protein